MTDQELRHLLAITFLPQIGSITARKLIAYTGSAEAVFKAKKSSLMKIPGIGNILAENAGSRDVMEKADKEMDFIIKKGVRIKTVYDPDYPERLKQCYDAPLILFYKGSELFNNPKILSVVGTRRATGYGIDVCNQMIRDLSERNPDILIVSGLAYGIDYNAHVAALKSGLKTIAVLAHGLHTIYPYAHRSLADKITANGALVTDFSTTDNPERNNFLKRNRIIAGLADATLVIESDEKGGALITADLAISYNRDVLAIPGRVNDQMSRGCNAMIRENMAALVNSSRDIENILGWDPAGSAVKPLQRSLFTELTEDEEKIVQVLKREDRIGPDILCVRTGFPVSKLSATIVGLEFKGVVSVLPGHLIRLN
jgi:DNA processing protein